MLAAVTWKSSESCQIRILKQNEDLSYQVPKEFYK